MHQRPRHHLRATPLAIAAFVLSLSGLMGCDPADLSSDASPSWDMLTPGDAIDFSSPDLRAPETKDADPIHSSDLLGPDDGLPDATDVPVEDAAPDGTVDIDGISAVDGDIGPETEVDVPVEPDCATHADCDSPGSCAPGVCTPDGHCAPAATGGWACCETDSDCNTAAGACGTATCTLGVCTVMPTPSLEPCCASIIYAEPFADGLDGFVVAGGAEEGQGWQFIAPGGLSNAPADATGGTLWYGDPQTSSYNFGKSSGTATSPAFTVPHGESTFYFRVHQRLEKAGGTKGDRLTVSLVFGPEGAEEVRELWTNAAYDQKQVAWTEHTADLSFAAGAQVRLRWRFNTVDSVGNQYAGVHIDSMRVAATCAAKACSVYGDCGAPLTCAGAACVDGACDIDWSAVGTSCGDAELTCQSGACDGGGLCLSLNLADGTGCTDDGDPCTVDECATGACEHPPVDDGSCCDTDDDCDSGNACEVASCVEGTCVNVPSDDEDCCVTDDDCAADACIAESACIAGLCWETPVSSPSCCTPGILNAWGFAATKEGFTVETPDDASVAWHHAAAGPAGLRAGVMAFATIPENEAGDATEGGVLLSAPVALPYGGVHISADIRVAGGPLDAVTWSLIRENGDVILLSTSGVPADPAVWTTETRDLSAFAGETVRWKWTVAGDATGPGIWVDEIVVNSACTVQSCSEDYDCDDGLSATTDQCLGDEAEGQAPHCVATPISTETATPAE